MDLCSAKACYKCSPTWASTHREIYSMWYFLVYKMFLCLFVFMYEYIFMVECKWYKKRKSPFRSIYNNKSQELKMNHCKYDAFIQKKKINKKNNVSNIFKCITFRKILRWLMMSCEAFGCHIGPPYPQYFPYTGIYCLLMICPVVVNVQRLSSVIQKSLAKSARSF